MMMADPERFVSTGRREASPRTSVSTTILAVEAASTKSAKPSYRASNRRHVYYSSLILKTLETEPRLNLPGGTLAVFGAELGRQCRRRNCDAVGCGVMAKRSRMLVGK